MTNKLAEYYLALTFVLLCWPLFIYGLYLDSPCFFPNGTSSANIKAGNDTKGTNLYKPCNLGYSVSMCCRPMDECRHDGLCNSRFDGLTWRRLCTDPTWESDECLKICINGTVHLAPIYDNPGWFSTQMANQDMPLTQCEDGSFCCGDLTVGGDCCKKGQGYRISAPEGNFTNTSAKSTTSQPGFRPKAGNKTAAIVGGTVGGVCGILLVINGVWFWLWYRRRLRPLNSPGPVKSHNEDKELDSKYCAPKTELAENQRPHEADGMAKYELYGSNR